MNSNASKEKIRNTQIIDFLVGGIGILLYLLSIQGIIEVLILSTSIIILALYCVIRVRRNRLLLILYGIIAYACYSICYANYFNRLDDTIYTVYADTVEAYKAVSLLLLFLSTLVLLLPKHIIEYDNKSSNPIAFKSNNLLVYIICGLIIVISVYGFARPDALGGDRGAGTPIYEYSIILFIIAFYLSGPSKGLHALILMIVALFALQNFIFGGRIHAIQALLVAFIFLLNKILNNKALLIVAILFIGGMIGLGVVRTSFWNGGIGAIVSGLASTLERGLAWDTAYSSWHTSITFIKYHNIVSEQEHFDLAVQWLGSIVFGGSSMPNSNLQELTRVFFYHNNGGILPIYLWFHFGLQGVIGSGVLVSALASATSRFGCRCSFMTGSLFHNSCTLCIVYFISTSLRWFLYSPSCITRGLLLCFFACVIVLWLDQTMRDKNMRMKSDTIGKRANAIK